LKKSLSAGSTVSFGFTHWVRNNFRRIAGFGIILFLFISSFIATSFLEGPSGIRFSPLISQDQVFDESKIHNVHIHFKDSAWQNMQPVGGPFGVDGVGLGWFDLSVVIGSVFTYRSDINRDYIISRDEFMTLGETWYREWQTKGDSILDVEMLDLGFGNESLDLRNVNGLPNGIGRILGIRTPLARADLRFEDKEFPAVSIRYKGNGTLMEAQGILKRSLKVDLNDGFRSRSIAGVSKLNLHNQVTDPGFMNDALAYRLYRDAGVPSPRTAFARVYLTVPDSLNHHYAGLYLLLENVDNNFTQSWYGTKKGSLFKPVTPRFFEDLGDDWDNYLQTYDPKTPLSIQEKNRIIEVCKFVSHSNEEEFSALLSNYFDLDQLARYLAVTVFICDLDGILGPGQNVYLYLHPKTFKLTFIPWDHDHSFGQMRGTQEERENLSIMKPWLKKNIFMERLINNEQFKTLYRKYLKEFNETIFRPERILHQVKELTPLLRPAVAEESPDKLKKFDYTSGYNPDPLPVDSANRNEPQAAKPLREYIVIRHKSIEDQLNGKSSGMIAKDGNYPKGMMGGMFLTKMDINKDNVVSHREFMNTFEGWFKKWSDHETGVITYQRLGEGINEDLSFAGPDPVKKQKSEL
jgi:spore coat protein H